MIHKNLVVDNVGTVELELNAKMIEGSLIGKDCLGEDIAWLVDLEASKSSWVEGMSSLAART